MRAFAAIELEADLCDALTASVRAMQAANPPLKVKWVRPEHQHLTLHFFGEINIVRVEDISGALQRAAGRVESFDIAPSDLGCFPSIYKPNVLWVGIDEPVGALQRLHKAVEAELALLGFTTESRSFTPHLTLARIPHNAASADRKAFGDWFVRQPPPASTPQHVTHLDLMRSDLFPEGQRYTSLSSSFLV